MTPTTFPTPSNDAIRHSLKLIQHIIAEIEAAGGWISFYDYMNMALYEPGLGYYAAGSHKIGAEGDFTTAPESSPLFGQCIGHFCAKQLNQYQNPIIFELGAGTGALCISVLQYLAQHNALPTAYWILEPSPDLRMRQQANIQAALPELSTHVVWLDQLPTQSFDGIILANEVLDALPIERFQVSTTGISTWGVGFDGQRFYQTTQPTAPKSALYQAVKPLQQHYADSWSLPYTSEVSLAIKPWLASICEPLVRGQILLIDYGYEADESYHPERYDGTLMCYYRHQVHSDPLMYPGLQDITAHVDFTAVANSASQLGLDILTYSTQSHFLLAHNLLQLAENQLQAEQQIRHLTHPNYFGDVFKVLQLAK